MYTEPSFLKACQYEFSNDTETFISTAEKLVIPYVWSTYNVLVLPKSFPYGGMENPNLTTVTPTLIAGDRSNVDVIAHEASHSWSGNLVTNATWQDFWLNEGYSPPTPFAETGWTMFLERKITGRMHGDEFAEFSAIIGWKALKDSVDQFGEDKDGFTKLVTKLDGKDPDDAFSSIPYVQSRNVFNNLRKKGSIFYTRFNLVLEEKTFLSRLCRPISVISVSNRWEQHNSRNFCINGLSKLTEKK